MDKQNFHLFCSGVVEEWSCEQILANDMGKEAEYRLLGKIFPCS